MMENKRFSKLLGETKISGQTWTPRFDVLQRLQRSSESSITQVALTAFKAHESKPIFNMRAT
jgi:hypothetical protein